ncbi:hypothetical protein ACEPAF_5469 [Sanghuangporus sanghuang]
MATLVQRTPSMLSAEYYNPKDTPMMDADAEICRLFGSLNLAGFAAVQPQVASEVKQACVQFCFSCIQKFNAFNWPIQPEVLPVSAQLEEDTSMSAEPDITAVTDGEGNVQVSPPLSHTGYPFLEIYEPKQFVETSSSKPPSEEEKAIEGCGLVQMLAVHYAPRLSHLHCATRDPDFNLLETILAHREQFVAFPYGHRSCSSALTKIAFEIERRNNEGQPYRDDPCIDMAIALHNEAWLMSGWYSK